MKKPLVSLLVFATFFPLACFAASPIDGTWKVEPGSYSQPKTPASYVVTKGVFECVSCPGKDRVRTDGIDHPVSGDPTADTLAVRLPDARTVETTAKKAGKLVSQVKLSLASDDKTMTRQAKKFLNGKPLVDETTYARITNGPPGSHWLSGSWRRARIDTMTESLVTFKTEGGVLSMSAPPGGSYQAPLDGTPAPIKGDPGTEMVSVRMKDARTLEEVAYRQGKPFMTTTMSVEADGQRAKVTWRHNQAAAWAAKYMFVPDGQADTGSYSMTRQ